jgi:hypothetical protein
MDRPGWAAQHIVSSWVFVAACLGHLLLNLRALRAYVVRKVSGHFRPQRILELILALGLLGYMVLGTIWNLPPWSNLLSGSQHYSDAVGQEFLREHDGLGRQSGQGRHNRRGLQR